MTGVQTCALRSSYTGRNGNILTGCSGVSGSHSAGTQVWPYAAVQMSSGVVSAQQTGYPVATLGWQRRKTPVPTDWLLYTSYLASTRQFQESGFLTDYYPSVISPAGQSAAQLSWSTQLTNNAQPYAWVANFLLVINQMGDLGRAKINELLGTLAQINVSPGAFVIDLPSSVGVAKYLLNTYFGLLTTDTNFTNILPMEHQIGSYAIAVRPLTEVLDDLARMTGCLIYYNPSGIVEWFDDPRWPLTLTAITNTLAAGGMRGELQWSESQPDIDYIILNATIVSQDAPIPIRIVYPPPAYPATEPATGLQGVEISGYFVTAQWEARNVAEGLFRERLIDGTATVTCTAATTWHAGDTVRVLWDFDGDGTAEERKYIVEQVEEARSGTGQARKLAYKLSLRRIRDY